MLPLLRQSRTGVDVQVYASQLVVAAVSLLRNIRSGIRTLEFGESSSTLSFESPISISERLLFVGPKVSPDFFYIPHARRMSQ